jgi:hypothetical protein
MQNIYKSCVIAPADESIALADASTDLMMNPPHLPMMNPPPLSMNPPHLPITVFADESAAAADESLCL